jgi:hypothetical protein
LATGFSRSRTPPCFGGRLDYFLVLRPGLAVGRHEKPRGRGVKVVEVTNNSFAGSLSRPALHI